jgi:hypothetical protein
MKNLRALINFAFIASAATACNRPSRTLLKEDAPKEQIPLLQATIGSPFVAKLSRTLIQQKTDTNKGYEYQIVSLTAGGFSNPNTGIGPKSSALQVPLFVDINVGGYGSERRAATTGSATVSVRAQATTNLLIEGGKKFEPATIGFTAPSWSSDPEATYDYSASGLFRRAGERKAAQTAQSEAVDARERVRNEVLPILKQSLNGELAKLRDDFSTYTQRLNSIKGLSSIQTSSSSDKAMIGFYSADGSSPSTQPPTFPSDRDVGIMINESIVQVVGTHALGDKTLSFDQMWQTLCQEFPKQSFAACTEPNRSLINYSFVFGSTPIKAEFREDKINLQVRFKLKIQLEASETAMTDGEGLVTPEILVSVVYAKGIRVFDNPTIDLSLPELQSQRESSGHNSETWAFRIAKAEVLSQLKNVFGKSIAGALFAPALPSIIDQGSLVVMNPDTDWGADQGWFRSWLSYCPVERTQNPTGLVLSQSSEQLPNFRNLMRVNTVEKDAAHFELEGISADSPSNMSTRRSGIQPGDIIYQVDGQGIFFDSPQMFDAYLRARSMSPSHASVVLSILRVRGNDRNHLRFRVDLKPACQL